MLCIILCDNWTLEISVNSKSQFVINLNYFFSCRGCDTMYDSCVFFLPCWVCVQIWRHCMCMTNIRVLYYMSRFIHFSVAICQFDWIKNTWPRMSEGLCDRHKIVWLLEWLTQIQSDHTENKWINTCSRFLGFTVLSFPYTRNEYDRGTDAILMIRFASRSRWILADGMNCLNSYLKTLLIPMGKDGFLRNRNLWNAEFCVRQ